MHDVVLNIFSCWLYLCMYFSVITFGFGMVYLAISFLIWATINLEGKIRTAKVWREAIKLYLERQKTNSKLKEEDLKFESEDKQ